MAIYKFDWTTELNEKTECKCSLAVEAESAEVAFVCLSSVLSEDMLEGMLNEMAN